MTRFFATAVVLALSTGFFVAWAIPPDTIHYQGVLRTTDGTPADGDHDMVFRFFDDVGNELLVDEHLASGSGAVPVADGLFSVALGSGVVSDGSGPFVWLQLAQMFRDNAVVELEIEVAGETLAPRVPIHAAPFAHNTRFFDGEPRFRFLDTTTDAQVKEGDLSVEGNLIAAGDRVTFGTAHEISSSSGSLSFKRFGQEGMSLDLGTLTVNGGLRLTPSAPLTYWNSVNGVTLGDKAQVRSVLSIRDPLSDAQEASPQINFQSLDTTRVLSWQSFYGQFRLTDDLYVFGDLIGYSLKTGSGTIDHASSRFTMDDSLVVDGTLQVGNGLAAESAYNRFGSGGAPGSGAVTNASDLFVVGDLEAGAFHGDTFEVIGVEFNMDGGDLRFNARSQHRVMVDSDNSTSANFAGWYHDGTYSNTTQLAKLTEAGNFQIAGTLSQNVAFDLAETFLASEPLSPGELVRVDPSRPDAVLRTIGAGDPAVLGVVSARPGVLLGSAPFSPEGLLATWGDAVADDFLSSLPDLRADVLARHTDLADRGTSDEVVALALETYWGRVSVPVALSGRVPVRVDASNGPIAIGDPLAPGRTPGVAARAVDAGPTIGIALQSLAAGEGTVMAFVSRGHLGGALEPTSSVAEADTRPVAPTYLRGRPAADGSSLLRPGAVAPETDAEAEVEAPSAFLPPIGPVLDTLPAQGVIEAGFVVSVATDGSGSAVAASSPADRTVLGVATDPEDRPVPDGHVVLALAGIVEVRADAGYGSIEPGDLLTTSPTTGHVMRTDDPLAGTVLGKAVTRLDSGVGTIRVLLAPR